MSLDKLDMMIIEELEDDARQSIPAIANKLGVKKSTIRYRLDRLISENTLCIVCLGNPELLGYQYLVFIGINVSPGKARVVTKQLEYLAEVKMLCETFGRYRIIVNALFADRLALKRFISEYLITIPEITSIEIMLSYQWVKSYWQYFKSQTNNSFKKLTFNPSKLDLSIVKAMQQDPRQTITKLSQTVGCNKAVAKRRLDKLIEQEVIKYACIIMPNSKGWEGISVIMLLECKLDNINKIADELSRQDEARLLSLITGQWHIFFGATFQDNNHMQRFLSDKLDLLTDIAKYEIIYITDILKYSLIYQD